MSACLFKRFSRTHLGSHNPYRTITGWDSTSQFLTIVVSGEAKSKEGELQPMMSYEGYQDRILTCRDCGQEFTFTAGEQEFFATKGLTNAPSRCPECRKARRNGSSSNQRP